MKRLYSHPLFLLGLAVRLVLIIIVEPLSVTEWYVPFLDATTTSLTFDPWDTWTQQGGVSEAYPYGYAMWLVFIPLALLFKLVGFPVLYSYGVTLLIADLLLLFVLHKGERGSNRLLLLVYWLSPIVVFATYGLGFNDLIPVLILTVSILFIRRKRFFISGGLVVMAVSAKLSMLIAVPFFIIYLFNNRQLRQFIGFFLKGMLLGGVLFWLPFSLSSSGISMLLGNPLMENVYQFTLGDSLSTKIYLVPLVFLVMLYVTWRIKKLNFDQFTAMMGLAFLLVVLVTPISPGWFIWLMPILVHYQVNSDRVSIAVVSVFSILYIFASLISYGHFLNIALLYTGNIDFQILIHTFVVAVGVVLALRIWRELISQNDYFKLSRKPFVIGVSGDSGSGKDTFTDAIEGLFGNHSVTKLSGDDYHLWDRKKPMWQVMTHLNPLANDLERYTNDLLDLSNGKAIQSRHYDHETGLMGRPEKVKSRDIIVASGLHALYQPILRERYDLSIYLDIDEELRKYFKLQRDVHQRGHSLASVLASFKHRDADAIKFIRPQAQFADLVLSLQPIHPRLLEKVDEKNPLRYKVKARSSNGFNEQTLLRVLVGICGLHVDMVTGKDSGKIELTIEGETSAEDIALAAKIICPRILEFLDTYPDWQGGVIGLMQLITLTHINQALIKRFI